jgi:hypothetical protein
MRYILELTISGLPKTINELNRKHWAVKAKEAKHWKQMIYLLTQKKHPNAPLKKARLVLTRHSAICPDFDGLVSSFKHCIDGLIDAEIIENDKMTNIGQPEYNWVQAKRNAGQITIRVEEA